jgi:hypothetical protein
MTNAGVTSRHRHLGIGEVFVIFFCSSSTMPDESGLDGTRPGQ